MHSSTIFLHIRDLIFLFRNRDFEIVIPRHGYIFTLQTFCCGQINITNSIDWKPVKLRFCGHGVYKIKCIFTEHTHTHLHSNKSTNDHHSQFQIFLLGFIISHELPLTCIRDMSIWRRCGHPNVNQTCNQPTNWLTKQTWIPLTWILDMSILASLRSSKHQPINQPTG